MTAEVHSQGSEMRSEDMWGGGGAFLFVIRVQGLGFKVKGLGFRAVPWPQHAAVEVLHHEVPETPQHTTAFIQSRD